MRETSISVLFMCKLCRESFEQVDDFIEHKREEHFAQFQSTTSIVFEEREQGEICPAITNNWNPELADESNERPIKVEVTDDYPNIPLNSEINDEPNLTTFESKNKPITYEHETNPDNKNSLFFGLKQPEQNPYVLLKRLTSEEIQKASVPQRHFRLLKYEQQNLANSSESPNSTDADNTIYDHREVETSSEIQPTATGLYFPREPDLFLECNLCSKQLESNVQLKIHVEICALYHKHQNRFCVICNRKFSTTHILKGHRLRFHGNEKEKSSLYRFKCHLCPKQFRCITDLSCHLKTHTKHKPKVEKSKPLKCSHPNCGKEFPCNSKLQNHISAVHLGLRPFICHLPQCSKSFSIRVNMERHFLTHTGERPFKCTVDNCNEAFITPQKRSIHHRTVHHYLFNK